jgi:hypothetical protein
MTAAVRPRVTATAKTSAGLIGTAGFMTTRTNISPANILPMLFME